MALLSRQASTGGSAPALESFHRTGPRCLEGSSGKFARSLRERSGRSRAVRTREMRRRVCRDGYFRRAFGGHLAEGELTGAGSPAGRVVAETAIATNMNMSGWT